MTETLGLATDWLSQNPQWLTAAIALAAFVESLAMVGVLVPGVALLYAAASLAGTANVPVITCLLAAVAGAVAGDGISFLLGRYAHGPLLKCWPFRRHPEWVTRGERFFARYGAASVLAGRFVGPIRPVLPFVAGMLMMLPQRFLVVNVASALLWAPAYILPGYLLGRLAVSDLTAPENGTLLNLVLLSLILLVLALMYATHHWLRPREKGPSPLRDRFGLKILESPRSGEQPAASLLLLLASLTAMVLLAVTLRLSELLKPLDHTFALIFAALRTGAFDPWVVGLTLTGNVASLLGLALIGGALLWWRGDRPAALSLLLGQSITLGAAFGLKWLMSIPRPEQVVTPPISFAFPSAHTAGTTFFIVMLASFIAQHRPYQRRWLTYGLAAPPVLAMALTRLYLGVHWLSDVMGGVLLGLMVVALMRLCYSPLDRPLKRHGGGWLAAALALLWVGGYLALELPEAVVGYGAR